MRKRILLLMAVCTAIFMVTACAGKNTDSTKETAKAAESTVSTSAGEDKDAVNTVKEEKQESSKSEETKPEVDEKNRPKLDTSKLDPDEAKGPGAVEGEEAEEENKNFTDLENSDYKSFASQIKEAVAAKDMNALADLMHYPAYVAIVESNEGMVGSREEFLALDAELVFDESLMEAIAAANVDGLEPMMAGIILGEDTPNIIFNSVDGKLGITGINY